MELCFQNCDMNTARVLGRLDFKIFVKKGGLH